MSYTKTTWVTGDIITADKLNNMENGIYGSYPLLVEYTSDGDTSTTLSCTYNQVKAALLAGSRVIAPVTIENEGEIHYYFPFVTIISESENLYGISFNDNVGNSSEFTAASPDAILSYTYGGGGPE